MKIFDSGIRFFTVKNLVRGENGYEEDLRGGTGPYDRFSVLYDDGKYNAVAEYLCDAAPGDEIRALVSAANEDAALMREIFEYTMIDDGGITVSFVSDEGEVKHFRGARANGLAKRMKELFDSFGDPDVVHRKYYPQQRAGAYIDPAAFAAAANTANGWHCHACGAAGNTGKFCTNCGTKKP